MNGLLDGDSHVPSKPPQAQSYPSPPLTAEGSPNPTAQMEVDPPAPLPLGSLPASQAQLAPSSIADHYATDASIATDTPPVPQTIPSEPAPLAAEPPTVQEAPVAQEDPVVQEAPAALEAPIAQPEPVQILPPPEAPTPVEALQPVSEQPLGLTQAPVEPVATPQVQVATQEPPPPAPAHLHIAHPAQSTQPTPSPSPLLDAVPAEITGPVEITAPTDQPPTPVDHATPASAKRSIDEASGEVAEQPPAAKRLKQEEPTLYGQPMPYPAIASPPDSAAASVSEHQDYSPAINGASLSTPYPGAFESSAPYTPAQEYAQAPLSLAPTALHDPSRPYTPRPQLDSHRSSVPMPKEQQKYANSILRTLKKSKDAPPFLAPVDPVYLGIPTYYDIIKEPMDLATAEKKLNSHSYGSAEDFANDVRRIFANCYRFNGETAPVAFMAKNLEAQFEKLMIKMPPAHAARAPKSYSPSASRKPSKNRDSFGDRPKREIHAPSPYDAADDYSAPAPVKKKRSTAYGAAGEEIKFCKEVYRELTKKAHQSFAWVFMEPVDYVKLNLPDYPKIVKRPMDLGSMKRKLDSGQYLNADSFYRDFKLLIGNCYAYNPPGTDVHAMGQQLDAVFDAKWLEKPEPFSDYGSGEESDEQITLMEKQLELMRENLAQLKEAKQRKKHEKRMQAAQAAQAARAAAAASAAAAAAAARPPPPPRPAPVSNGAAAPKSVTKAARRTSTGAAPSRPRKSGRQSSDDEFVGFQEVTYQMKQDLANGIGNFEGEQLQRAIDIIRKSRPDLLGDESKEIELDIDQLDANTLLKLYNYVVGPVKKQRVKQETLTASGQRAQKGGRAGTGGLKGKSLNEDEETARIRALEAKLQAFQTPGGGGAGGASDSSSESDASDSDSE